MFANGKTTSETLPEPGGAQLSSNRLASVSIKAVAAAVVISLTLLTTCICNHRHGPVYPHDLVVHGVCPQVSELVPERNQEIWEALGSTYSTEAFRSKAVDWLSGAVQVPTESYDYLGLVGVDSRWEIFQAFHDYLFEAFPLVHTVLELTKVNTYGLVYVWKGSNGKLKPLLLAAHQVSFRCFSQMSYLLSPRPSSNGSTHLSLGDFVWGRGSSDDKSGLIGIMSAVETMLANGYRPTRTVVLAFGFDEECGGSQGAQSLAVKLEEMFGKDGYAMLVDEGAGYGEQFGRMFATPGIAEKGTMDVLVKVKTPGGHSSIPPPHTSIGILAQLLVKIEENPFKVELARGSPTYKSFRCLAAHAPALPKQLRRDILRSSFSEKALHAAEKELFKNPAFKSLVGTTQAIDIIQGGVKVNALPEEAWAIMNHRISTESSVDETKFHDTEILKPLAKAFNLSYTAFGARINHIDDPAYGSLDLSEPFGQTAYEPAPITPTDEGAAPYELLSGTIKAAYNSHRGVSGDDTIAVSPGIMSGNTDTRFYWRLTRHIFRYRHHAGAAGGLPPKGIHTVNEAMSIENFVEIIRFFTTLILNVDESLLS
ncbi:hypothetical protein ID866_8460 [Astraeus odoratus]|nr:hypothetical protein ID866_8460 [Astraeus odoratus]